MICRTSRGRQGGGGGGGGEAAARGGAARDRLAQSCQMLTPSMLRRGHFHWEVSGTGGDEASDVEVREVAAVGVGVVQYGQERVACPAAHHAHFSEAEQCRDRWPIHQYL